VSYVRDYLEVAIVNDGLTLGSASINLLVPDFFSRMWRWEARRTPSPKGTMLRTSEALDGLHESIYWAETGIRLPGRMTTLMHFHLSGRQPGEHAFKLKVIADELDDDFVLAGTFVIAERTESF
jgi:hypothetical protein